MCKCKLLHFSPGFRSNISRMVFSIISLESRHSQQPIIAHWKLNVYFRIVYVNMLCLILMQTTRLMINTISVGRDHESCKKSETSSVCLWKRNKYARLRSGKNVPFPDVLIFMAILKIFTVRATTVCCGTQLKNTISTPFQKALLIISSYGCYVHVTYDKIILWQHKINCLKSQQTWQTVRRLLGCK